MFNKIFKEAHWSERLRLLRLNNKLTQQQVADKCIITHKMYWNWEKGRHYPRKRFRICLAKIFGVEEDYIFS
ncbi:hypothetical protein CPAST_c06850 [Clostridium pasteurianum DSM 525 = ATCC 6013]|uniref:Helix-turn-helix domain protein n=1 Tax=Clostridium pasteurianum DSM 525 = ATCC 6013 TaxID=1262449 RepID=A0A0H3J728_CLOPA|nr:helix-turn-helix transcriptional regulator [Clostridium pasteurianum]AJA46785.1 hypothetical protein CPAST_c06850 [Clostridium pasteurianum DSM 525 = ATCC 6013]AJA50773.1 hypothetical protein CLPA_c06850 [Clostridium pasteurianum DSM 525 = ATCC 6013]AOZ74179.1 transcriptional regulator [Clostridium pasteurianum DSM 525 = ATCC 6013]AOZ77977.1 transcriptional regulator [Clostridium pasteurianum]ELP58604.1 hypothetical protein F502_14030 [Clostridium pasteurianum DSM 525 = ATCC 6013]